MINISQNTSIKDVKFMKNLLKNGIHILKVSIDNN